MIEDPEGDIDASKAPLIEHLMELRERLIKALAAFVVMFISSFFFCKRYLQYTCCSLHARSGSRS